MSSEENKPRKIPKFSPEEDRRLTYLIVECKHTNWVTIAALMPGRNVRQCRERWRHVLCKKASNTEWTEDEDKLLMDKYKEYGRKWNHIQTSLPNHTVVQVKNRIKFLLNEDPHPRKHSKKYLNKVNSAIQQPVIEIQPPTEQIEENIIQSPIQEEVAVQPEQVVLPEPEQEVPVKIIEKQILPETHSERIAKSSIDTLDSLFNSLNLPFRSRESSIDWFGVSQDNFSSFWN